MSGILEQILAEQQKTNTFLEQLVANGVATPTADAGATGKTTKTSTTKTSTTKTTAVKPTHTKDEVVAAVVAVKDAFGAPEAKKITAQFGLGKIAEAKEDQFDAIFAACEEKLATQNADDGNAEDDV